MKKDKRAVLLLLLLLCSCAGCGTEPGTQEAESPPPAAADSRTRAEEPAGLRAEENAGPPAETADGQPESPPEPEADVFVRVQAYIPDCRVDLRYAAAQNFTGQVIYDFSDAYLRCGTMKKLRQAQALLAEQGYALCIWDAFRPARAQDALWRACPDGNYVADPANGYSGHTRGNTVDVTLVSADGQAVEMPSGFDDFSARADRDYSDVSEAAAAHAALLEQAMAQSGFTGYQMEWWHYSDTDSYPAELEFVPPES